MISLREMSYVYLSMMILTLALSVYFGISMGYGLTYFATVSLLSPFLTIVTMAAVVAIICAILFGPGVFLSLFFGPSAEEKARDERREKARAKRAEHRRNQSAKV